MADAQLVHRPLWQRRWSELLDQLKKLPSLPCVLPFRVALRKKEAVLATGSDDLALDLQDIEEWPYVHSKFHHEGMVNA